MTNRPTLETRRLLLRPFEAGDAQAIANLAGDAAVADTTLNIPHPYTLADALAWIGTHAENFAQRREVVLAVVRKEDGALLGACGLVLSPEHRRGELGYWVGKAYWGQGYCTEAARALVEYGFRTLGLERIYAQHFSRNPASGRVMQKLGMRHEGHLRHHIQKRGQFEDLEIYGLLRQEYLAQSESAPPDPPAP